MNKKVITAVMMYWYPYEGALQPIYKAVFDNLSENGYRINIVAGIPHYRKGRPDLWSEYQGVFYRQNKEGNLNLKRVFVFSPKIDIYFDENGILRRLINYFSFFISTLIFTIFDKSFRPRLLFVPTFPPLFSGLLAWSISVIKRAPFIYNVQDVYPDIATSIPLFRIKGIFFLLE